MRHTKRNELDCLATTHVDDIKATAVEWVLKELISVLEKHFGKGEVDITYGIFKACGLRHIPIPNGYSLDQTEYLNAL